jgi:hypothetical protein
MGMGALVKDLDTQLGEAIAEHGGEELGIGKLRHVMPHEYNRATCGLKLRRAMISAFPRHDTRASPREGLETEISKRAGAVPDHRSRCVIVAIDERCGPETRGDGRADITDAP